MEHKKLKNQKGFTLVELLVVVSILIVLVGIVTMTLNSGGTKASAQAINYLEKGRQLAQAAEAYYIQNDEWPANSTALIPNFLKSVPDGWTDTKSDCKAGGTSNYPCQVDVNNDSKDDYTVQAEISEEVCKKLLARSDYGKLFAIYKGSTSSSSRLDSTGTCGDGTTDQNFLVYMIRPGS